MNNMKSLTFDENWSTDRRRDAMLDMLRGYVCSVTFTKVNGETRTMPCTLDPKWLPTKTGTESHKKFNPNILSVWCTDKQQWRSFRLDNVLAIEQIQPDLDALMREF